MRFTTVTVALLGAAASASASALSRRQSAIPDCAMPCLVNAEIPPECQPTDNACLCRNDGFIAGTTACVRGACSGEDLEAALFASQELCRQVGVTLTEEPTDTASDDTSSSTDAPPAPSSSSGAASGTPASSTSKATSTSGTSASSTGNATSTSGTAGPAQTSPKSSAMTTSIHAFTVVAALALAAFTL